MIEYCKTFGEINNDERSRVFEIFPSVFSDNRGSFSEVLKSKGYWPYENEPLWFNSLSWIKQINRSKSKGGTVRGLHAQSGWSCQGKLVESLTHIIYDIIIDARPNSRSFGVCQLFKLDPLKQNKLWVPRGFLHGFIVPKCDGEAIFNYYCDATYCKTAEIGINPKDVVQKAVSTQKEVAKSAGMDEVEKMNDLFKLFDDSDQLVFSEKDIKGLDYTSWMQKVKYEFEDTGKLWYR